MSNLLAKYGPISDFGIIIEQVGAHGTVSGTVNIIFRLYRDYRFLLMEENGEYQKKTHQLSAIKVKL